MCEISQPSTDTTPKSPDWKKIIWNLYTDYANLNNQEIIKYSSPKFPGQSIVLYDDLKILYLKSIHETYMFNLRENEVTKLTNGTLVSLKIDDMQLKSTILTIEHILQTSSIQGRMWYSVKQIVDDLFDFLTSWILSPVDFHPTWAKASGRI